MINKVLVVVDMQNDFLTGSLAASCDTNNLIENVSNKIQKYNMDPNAIVLATRDTHYNDEMQFENKDSYLYKNTIEHNYLPIEHCIKDTNGWELENNIKDLILEDNIFNKNTFMSIDLINYLKELSLKNDFIIELVGVCTGICVLSNAIGIKGNLSNNKIIVDSSCCACVNEESHKNALESMKMCHIEII